MLQLRIPIRWALKRVEMADTDETDEIITSLLKCYKRLNPQYELVIISLPKYNSKERKAEIDRIANCLKKEYIDEYIKD